MDLITFACLKHNTLSANICKNKWPWYYLYLQPVEVGYKLAPLGVIQSVTVTKG